MQGKREDPREVWGTVAGEKLDSFYSEAEQIHYFGLCKPDHSDCPFDQCLYQHLRAQGRLEDLDRLIKEGMRSYFNRPP